MALVHWPTEIKLLVFGHFLAGEKKQSKILLSFFFFFFFFFLGRIMVNCFFELSRDCKFFNQCTTAG